MLFDTKINSIHSYVLRIFKKLILQYFVHLCIKPVSLPTYLKKFTLVKSPHVHKKSREQFSWSRFSSMVRNIFRGNSKKFTDDLCSRLKLFTEGAFFFEDSAFTIRPLKKDILKTNKMPLSRFSLIGDENKLNNFIDNLSLIFKPALINLFNGLKFLRVSKRNLILENVVSVLYRKAVPGCSMASSFVKRI